MIDATPTALVSYDRLSRRTSLALGNGTSAKYDYTARGDLTCFDWNFTGPTPAACNVGTPELAPPKLSYDFTYMPNGQTRKEIVTGAGYFWEPAGASDDTYVVNGLNQYTQITPQTGPAASIVHDEPRARRRTNDLSPV